MTVMEELDILEYIDHNLALDGSDVCVDAIKAIRQRQRVLNAAQIDSIRARRTFNRLPQISVLLKEQYSHE